MVVRRPTLLGQRFTTMSLDNLVESFVVHLYVCGEFISKFYYSFLINFDYNINSLDVVFLAANRPVLFVVSIVISLLAATI